MNLLDDRSSSARNIAVSDATEPVDFGIDLYSVPRMSIEDERKEILLLSNEEALLAFADVYGYVPNELEDLKEFDRALSLLPVARKSAVHRGYTVRQVRQFLLIENNDPKAAAERFARYWEMREHQLGEDAFKEDNTTARTEADYRRVYDMARRAMSDEEVDAETRNWAKNYIQQYNMAHVIKLDEEMEKISADQKVALKQAQMLLPDIATSDEHKLLFLKCEEFDAKRAAHRMVSYWNMRLNLFGPPTGQNGRGIGKSGASCPVSIDDLTEECPLELSLGFFQLLPGADSSGRDIFCFWPTMMLGGDCEINNVLRVVWYVFHAALQKGAGSEKGAVIVVILKNHPTPSRKKGFWNIATSLMHLFVECAPVKICAVHDCAPPTPWFHIVFTPILKWYLGRRLRSRYRVHIDQTEDQVVVELEACGISRGLIPMVLGGQLDLTSTLQDFLEKQREAGL